mmetsp:Transcript_15554/g.28281  ORF Transcript_15554/g.28281 Transcript_15554/m.28281 type:complete len:362 (-) Transcript_15554:79-1164(-)
MAAAVANAEDQPLKNDATEVQPKAAIKPGVLDLRRKAQIARGGPVDHCGAVAIVPDPHFDLDRTIFQTLDSKIARKLQRDKLGVTIFWNEDEALKIQELFVTIPPAVDHDKPLMDFMANECNFAMEHADGSFMDHLQFCYEYGVRHFQPYSPRVLLLHSILGVGTNFFPMEAVKIPQLESFLDDFERLHVKAFPAVLRLLYHGPLLEELTSMSEQKLAELQGMRFHAVIDNSDLYLNADAFWVNLNYQLIHLLDFLPLADWELNKGDGFLVTMAALHALLTRSGKLMAHVDLELSPLVDARPAPFHGTSSSKRLSLGKLVSKLAPGMGKKLLNKSIQGFSDKIGHKLTYELVWPDHGSSRL